jgi:hypothetical protein
MSQLIQDFSQKLVTAVPSATVDPLVNKKGGYPAVLFSVRNDVRPNLYAGDQGIRNSEFTIDIYAKNYSEVQNLKGQVVAAFHGFSGQMGSTLVHRCDVRTSLETFVTEPEQIFRVILIIDLKD